MLIGATSLGFGSVTLEEVFDGLAAVGGECTELNGLPGRHGGVTLSGAEVKRVKALSASSGVQVTSVGGYNDFAKGRDHLDEEVGRLLDACRIAHELEVPVVRAMVADAAPGVTLDNIRPDVVEGFRRACARAGQLGVTLGIENHGRLANNGSWLASVVDEVDAPNLGFTVDTGNFAWAERTPTTVHADLACVLPQAVNVHVKDVRWDGEGHFENFVTAGTGAIDVEGILATLRSLGYLGPVVSEYEGHGSHRDGTAASIEYLKRIRNT
ncbi:sugar phosphate isomerase/epimerase family protein [Lapillicoccus sp.]|uniref:sugar phosphate isomerase/epimerase family protein n=1 Tax=Lapillicoccus sp. TaxID=1909287 RepID=UPI0032632A41